MKHLTGNCVSTLTRTQPRSTARIARTFEGVRRGVATGGHYSVPKPFNEPNVNAYSARVNSRSTELFPVSLCDWFARATKTRHGIEGSEINLARSSSSMGRSWQQSISGQITTRFHANAIGAWDRFCPVHQCLRS